MMGPMHSGALAAITSMVKVKTKITRRAAFLVDAEIFANIIASVWKKKLIISMIIHPDRLQNRLQ